MITIAIVQVFDADVRQRITNISAEYASDIAEWVNARRPHDEDTAIHLIDFRAKLDRIMTADMSDTFDGLTVVYRSWPAGRETPEALARLDAADLAGYRAALGPVESVTLTADARMAEVSGWCTCPSDDADAGMDRWVQYERYTSAGRVAHGFVCRDCRSLLQAG